MVRMGRVFAAIALLGAGAACGVRAPSPSPAARYDEPFFARKPLASYTIPTPRPGVPTDTVVGRVRTISARTGDTLLDLARLHDLGYEEMHDANPGIDPWVPPVGAKIVVPTAFVLPCCTYDGLVINIPEMRVYFYRPGPRTGTTIVETFPLGLGRGEYPTPMGVFRIKGKTVNPAWGVPEKIRLEHLRERGDGRAFIKGGDPDNPLGKYRFELDRTLYRIHGTNFPWGIGRLVSHGCAQLYPEDIAHLFPLVPIGTRVEFVYQPVKVGRRDGATWVEAHRDVYRRVGRSYDLAIAALQKQGLSADSIRVRDAVRSGDGVPRVVKDGGWVRWPKLL
jgi:L,D-transpeptidase ErfK/SrfK